MKGDTSHLSDLGYFCIPILLAHLQPSKNFITGEIRTVPTSLNGSTALLSAVASLASTMKYQTCPGASRYPSTTFTPDFFMLSSNLAVNCLSGLINPPGQFSAVCSATITKSNSKHLLSISPVGV